MGVARRIAGLSSFDHACILDVGFSLVRSTFVVSKPPHREGGKWKMTVDGVELTKVE